MQRHLKRAALAACVILFASFACAQTYNPIGIGINRATTPPTVGFKDGATWKPAGVLSPSGGMLPTFACSSSQWANSASAGAIGCAQPAYSDISNFATGVDEAIFRKTVQYPGLGVNGTTAAQAAYNAVGHLGWMHYAPGTWTLDSSVTATGGFSVLISDHPGGGTVFASQTEFLRAFPEVTTDSGYYWRNRRHMTFYATLHGGLDFLSFRNKTSGSVSGYQRDVQRVFAIQEDPSTGPSWDGVGGTNINRALTTYASFIEVPATNANGAIWNQNLYGVIRPSGGDGTWRASEANLDNGGSDVSGWESPKSKLGYFATVKGGSGTAAFVFGTGGGGVGGPALGWYNGLVADQDGLVNDTASRFLKLTGLFEVNRDGLTLVGKGTSALGQTGIELHPDGTFYRTSNAAATDEISNRIGTPTGAITLATRQARGLSDTGVARTYTQVVDTAQTVTNGAEASKIAFQTMAAGTLGEKFSVETDGVKVVGGTTVKGIISSTATLDFASIAAGASATLTMTLTGVAGNDQVIVTPFAGVAGLELMWTAYASATNTVTIRVFNPTAGAIDPPSATFRATAIKF